MALSHLNALQALEATLRLGSFSAAAIELGVTPAAVGQRVRALEEYLGGELFLRTPSGIKAQENVRNVEGLLTNSFSGLASALTELKNRNPGSQLSVTLPASFVENWLTSLISEFYQRHTSVDLRLDASNRDVDLVTESFDFAVRYGEPPSDELENVVLFEDYILPVCSPNFARQYAIDPISRSLKDIPLIHVEGRTRDPSWVGFDGWGTTFGFVEQHLGHGVHFSKVSSGLQAAIGGQGLVLCGLVEAFNSIRSGLLVAPFGPNMNCKTDGLYRLLWVRHRPMGKIQLDFRDWLLEKATDFKRESENFRNGGAEWLHG
ncbi:LysR substrate-binding domain-containing protein [Ruegeria arenilitoris]|uniref:LysR substrate-binding domain-containing protein n=1 Tax=Ruegeria arenilitoris TaxID=1173585 RepID=UPI001479BCB6|nr:LysR substrate-binding domain-containing protein [Ruegeria arenilitoris]